MERTELFISLQPSPYYCILRGEKVFEFRNRFINAPTRAYLYISKEIKAVVGYVEMGAPFIGTREELCNLAELTQPGLYDGVYRYLRNDEGYALPVEKLALFQREIGLEELRFFFSELYPPQAYYYLARKIELHHFFKQREIGRVLDFTDREWKTYIRQIRKDVSLNVSNQ